MMETAITAEWLEKVAKQWRWLSGGKKDDGVVKVTDLLVEDAVPKGSNYAGILLRLKATLALKSGTKKNVSLILKLLLPSQEEEHFAFNHYLYTTETKIYDNVLSKMEDLVEESGDKREIFWPRHFTIKENNCLLLEDLKIAGFATAGQREATYEEGQRLVELLGRFHAMSRVLIDKGAIDVSNMQVHNMAQNDTIIEFVYTSTLRAIIDSIRTTWDTKWYSSADVIESSLEKIKTTLKGLVEQTRGEFNVLNHGDCWLNNIMMKKPSSDTTEIKLLDFQLCSYNSFAWDLTHFIYCSYLPDEREKNLPKLVSGYRRSLVESLKLYGKCQDEHEVPSAAEMVDMLSKVKLFGLLVSLATLPRLLPGIKLDLDLDINKPQEAQKTKASMYSIPEVSEQTSKDLISFQNLIAQF